MISRYTLISIEMMPVVGYHVFCFLLEPPSNAHKLDSVTTSSFRKRVPRELRAHILARYKRYSLLVQHILRIC
jgi:hypothetical protein